MEIGAAKGAPEVENVIDNEICGHLKITVAKARFYSVAVITPDSDSGNPGSSPGRTSIFSFCIAPWICFWGGFINLGNSEGVAFADVRDVAGC